MSILGLHRSRTQGLFPRGFAPVLHLHVAVVVLVLGVAESSAPALGSAPPVVGGGPARQHERRRARVRVRSCEVLHGRAIHGDDGDVVVMMVVSW